MSKNLKIDCSSLNTFLLMPLVYVSYSYANIICQIYKIIYYIFTTVYIRWSLNPNVQLTHRHEVKQSTYWNFTLFRSSFNIFSSVWDLNLEFLFSKCIHVLWYNFIIMEICVIGSTFEWQESVLFGHVP